MALTWASISLPLSSVTSWTLELVAGSNGSCADVHVRPSTENQAVRGHDRTTSPAGDAAIPTIDLGTGTVASCSQASAAVAVAAGDGGRLVGVGAEGTSVGVGTVVVT